jgi:hypothetical protein
MVTSTAPLKSSHVSPPYQRKCFLSGMLERNGFFFHVLQSGALYVTEGGALSSDR